MGMVHRVLLICLLTFCFAILFNHQTRAQSCGNTAEGFPAWLEDFKREARANGISQRTIERSLTDVRYARKTIRADRGQKSFRLSLDQFMKKRGADTIVKRGRKLKDENASLLSRIERRYGVPPGILMAIWGMETGFGRFSGNQPVIPAVATLAYDCRRSDFFKRELYAALELVERRILTPEQMRGAGHGEIGQTQFLPSSYLKYAVDGDGDGKKNLIASRPDALASTANFLLAHGWRRGAGYQPGEPNFAAIKGWNAASVYQQAIAIIAARIDS